MQLPEKVESSIKNLTNISYFKKICIFAVGESMIAGQIMSSYSDNNSSYQIVTITDSRVPAWVNYDTTSILISYSGYNDVINKIYNELKIRNSSIICLTSGGSLMNNCIHDGNTLFRLQPNLTPRTAIGEELGMLISIIGSIDSNLSITKIKESLEYVKEFRKSLIDGKIISKVTINKLAHKSIAVYGISELFATCKRWKTALNTDTMCLAFCSDLPEFDHNELVGWANHRQPTNNVIMIVLKCKTNPIMTNIIDSMIDVLKEHGREVLEIDIPGTNTMEKNLCGILIGDYISQKLSSKLIPIRGPSE